MNQPSLLLRIVRVLLWIITIVVSLGMLGASFGGNIAPSEIKGICLLPLTFSIWLVLLIFITILDIIWCRKAIPVLVLVYVACASAIWEFSPLNIGGPSLEKYARDPKFTFMTYNVANFDNLSGKDVGDYNPTVSYILKNDADIVNLQEAIPFTPDNMVGITKAQIDSLHKRYPYILLYGQNQVLLSKYPAQPIHTGAANDNGNEIALFRLNIEGISVTLINVHLESYRLTDDDKALYKEVTKLKENESGLKSTVKEVKSTLLSKVQQSAVLRQEDTERLCNYIERFGGPNVIVAGDFNDVPGCYALRRLADYKMKQAYTQLGFGPMITFNADRFYFRIDHVLYRGDLVPLRMHRGSVKWSDHYPLLMSFAIPRSDTQTD